MPKKRVNSLFTGGKATRLGANVIKMGDVCIAWGVDTLRLLTHRQSKAAAGDDAFLAEVLAEVRLRHASIYIPVYLNC